MSHSIVARVLRAGLAAAFALSWLALTGLPAAAAVTRVYVTAPKPDAVLAKAALLEVMVDRTAPAENETVEIQTRLHNAKGEPIPKGKVLSLIPDKKPVEQTTGGDRLRFTGAIDPYNLAWLPKGGVAPNAKYELQYREIVRIGETTTSEGGWKTYQFWLNAPPPEPLPPAAQVADAARKRIRVAWQRNPAPDLTSYTLQRQRDGGKWEQAKAGIKPATTQVTDTVTKLGTYRYRIVAYRPGARPPEPKQENPSEPPAEADQAAAAEEPKEEPKPPPPVFSVSPRSRPVVLGTTSSPAPRFPSGSGTTSGGSTSGSTSGSSSGFGTGTGAPSIPSGSTGGSTSSSGQPASQPFDPQTPDISAPPGFDETFKGPLSFGVEPREVTERVPVEIAQGGAADDTLTVLNRAIDQERVLPPVAGGLILVVSAAHVLRYLNE